MNQIKKLTCIVCPSGCALTVGILNGEICSVEGNSCRKGLNYARNECLNPVRALTTTIRVDKGSSALVPIKSEKPVPKALVMDCVKVINHVVVNAPVKRGDIVVENILGTGINIVATKDIPEADAELFTASVSLPKHSVRTH